MLRKVSEYIYIGQPQGIRRFPDFTTADSSTAGLLKVAKFNSITINVDSAWSEDVGQYGWIIPPWNRSAAAGLSAPRHRILHRGRGAGRRGGDVTAK